MTRYKLEEFRAWLEEKPERKGDLQWDVVLTFFASNVQNLSKGKPWNSPFAPAFKQWMAEVDQRERERERERESNRRKAIIW